MEDLALKAKFTALKADTLRLATIVNSYAGNLDLLRQMQELSRKLLSDIRKIDDELKF